MKRLLVGLAIALPLLIASTADAKWVEIGRSDETTLEIDDRIQSEGQYRWYWTRFRHTNPIDGRRTRIDSYQSADCYTRQVRVRETKAFDGRGRLLDRQVLGDSAPLEFVQPGTLRATAFEVACGQ